MLREAVRYLLHIMEQSAIQEFIRLAESHPTEEGNDRARFASLGRQMAVHLAVQLGLRPGSFDLRIYPLQGEITLQSDDLRVDMIRAGGGFTFRSCTSRTDPQGGCPNWLSYRSLSRQPQEVLRMMRGIMELSAGYKAAV